MSSGRRSTILNLLKLKFFTVGLYLYLKPHIFSIVGLMVQPSGKVFQYYVYSSQKWLQVSHFEFDQFEIFYGISTSEAAHTNGLAICGSALLNMIKLKFFMVYPYLKLHILFNSYGLAIWPGSPDITHINKIFLPP